jgi:hypothetical protein
MIINITFHILRAGLSSLIHRPFDCVRRLSDSIATGSSSDVFGMYGHICGQSESVY